MGETGISENVNNEYTTMHIELKNITHSVQMFIAKHHNQWCGSAASFFKQIEAFKPLNDLQWPRSSMEMTKWLRIATHDLRNMGIVVRAYKWCGVRLIAITT